MKSEYSPIISPKKLHSVQMDLVDMRSLNAKANEGYQYLMTTIDVWSRFTVAVQRATPRRHRRHLAPQRLGGEEKTEQEGV